MEDIEDGIRGFDPSPATFTPIWAQAMPDSTTTGYEMMLMARHDADLRTGGRRHSVFRKRRLAVLNTLFDPGVAETEALPLLDAIADFYRGAKIKEVMPRAPRSRCVRWCGRARVRATPSGPSVKAEAHAKMPAARAARSPSR